MESIFRICFLIFLLSQSILFFCLAEAQEDSSILAGNGATIGVNYGAMGNNLPPPSAVPNIVKQQCAMFTRVKIFGSLPEFIAPFSGSNLKLTIAIPNENVSKFFSFSDMQVDDWVKKTVGPFSSTIDMIVIGNEMDVQKDSAWRDLPSVLSKVWASLNRQGLSKIKVTTPITQGIIGSSFPPSNGVFSGFVTEVLPKILDFLSSSGSPFMLNAYPYFSWKGDKEHNTLDYALFKSQNPVHDGNYQYYNLFDAIVDTVVAALEKAGHGNLPIVIGESGWPSDGGKGATIENAKAYNSGLVSKVKNNQGSPRRPGALTMFIFALFNENKKHGAAGDATEQHFGLLYPDGSPVYNICS